MSASAVLLVSLSVQFNASALDLVDRARSAGTFDTLLAAADAAGLLETLKGPGPYTVFAPSEKAFAKLPSGTISNLLKPENKKSLAYIISYHVIEGRLTSFDIPFSRIEVPTLNGASVSLLTDGRTSTADAAKIISDDIYADNGVIHVIDKVLLPGVYRAPSVPTYSEAPVEKPTVTAKTQIVDVPEPKVVRKKFTPLKYDLRTQGKTTQKRVRRSVSGKNLVQTADAAGQFRTLLLALQIARMDKGVAKYQDYTVFAPTDQAFENIPRRTLDFLLNPRNRSTLVNLLAHHIVDGKLTSDRIRNGRTKLKSLNPRYPLIINKRNGRVTVNNATVIQADVGANNGVIHVIDRVLLTSTRLLRR